MATKFKNFNHDLDKSEWSSRMHESRNSAKARKHAKRASNRDTRHLPIRMDDSAQEFDLVAKRNTAHHKTHGLKNMAFYY